jgi:hypothetical protein
MYLVPPMDDVPPDDFVEFVAGHLSELQFEAARLTGGPEHADEVYPDALTDVAGHWRRLRLRRRLLRRDVPGAYLAERLATRAKQWRDRQVYEIEVVILRPLTFHAAPAVSIALRKADLLPGTARAQVRPLAEAAIAWSHAWRLARWRRIGRVAAGCFVVFIALVQLFPVIPD